MTVGGETSLNAKRDPEKPSCVEERPRRGGGGPPSFLRGRCLRPVACGKTATRAATAERFGAPTAQSKSKRNTPCSHHRPPSQARSWPHQGKGQTPEFPAARHLPGDPRDASNGLRVHWRALRLPRGTDHPHQSSIHPSHTPTPGRRAVSNRQEPAPSRVSAMIRS